MVVVHGHERLQCPCRTCSTTTTRAVRRHEPQHAALMAVTFSLLPSRADARQGRTTTLALRAPAPASQQSSLHIGRPRACLGRADRAGQRDASSPRREDEGVRMHVESDLIFPVSVDSRTMSRTCPDLRHQGEARASGRAHHIGRRASPSSLADASASGRCGSHHPRPGRGLSSSPPAEQSSSGAPIPRIVIESKTSVITGEAVGAHHHAHCSCCLEPTRDSAQPGKMLCRPWEAPHRRVLARALRPGHCGQVGA